MFYVYILKSVSKDTLYVGQTNNLSERLKRHNLGQVISTRSKTPWIIIWSTQKDSRSEALKLEKYLKSLSHSRKLEFISKYS